MLEDQDWLLDGVLINSIIGLDSKSWFESKKAKHDDEVSVENNSKYIQRIRRRIGILSELYHSVDLGIKDKYRGFAT